MTGTVVGHFSDNHAAQVAVERLQQAGFLAEDVSYAAHDGAGHLPGPGTVVTVRADEATADRAGSALRDAGASEVRYDERPVQSSGGFDPADPHTSPANYGDEGGSSQWGQTVLRVRNGESEIADRTVSRDAGSKRMD